MFRNQNLQAATGNGTNIVVSKSDEARYNSMVNGTALVALGLATVFGLANVVSDVTNKVKTRIAVVKETLAQKGVPKEDLKNFGYNPLCAVTGENEKTLENLQGIRMFGPFSRKEDSLRVVKFNPHYTPVQVSQAVSKLWK